MIRSFLSSKECFIVKSLKKDTDGYDFTVVYDFGSSSKRTVNSMIEKQFEKD
jgi:hypothetical protein